MLSEHVPLFGEVGLTREQYEPLLKLANTGVLVAGRGLRYQIGPVAMIDDRSSARFFYALCPRSVAPKVLSDWIQQASAQEQHDFALQTYKDVHLSLTAIVKCGGPDAILGYQPRFVEFVTPAKLPAGRVTVLGDAAHAMVPFRGLGANTAVIDAGDLANVLLRAHKDGIEPHSVVPAYHAKMIPCGMEAVLSSRAGGNSAMNDPATYFKYFSREQ